MTPNQSKSFSSTDRTETRGEAVAWRDVHDHATLYHQHPGEGYEVEPLYLAGSSSELLEALRLVEQLAHGDTTREAAIRNTARAAIKKAGA